MFRYPSKSKYNARKTTIDGIAFDSKAEGRFWTEYVKPLWRSGQISGVILQPGYDVEIDGTFVCRYHADFQWIEEGQIRIVDVKGVQTPEFKIKARAVEALTGIAVETVKKARRGWVFEAVKKGRRQRKASTLLPDANSNTGNLNLFNTS